MKKGFGGSRKRTYKESKAPPSVSSWCPSVDSPRPPTYLTSRQSIGLPGKHPRRLLATSACFSALHTTKHHRYDANQALVTYKVYTGAVLGVLVAHLNMPGAHWAGRDAFGITLTICTPVKFIIDALARALGLLYLCIGARRAILRCRTAGRSTRGTAWARLVWRMEPFKQLFKIVSCSQKLASRMLLPQANPDLRMQDAGQLCKADKPNHPLRGCVLQDGYIEERSVAGPVNLTVPGGAAGEAALPLRLLDGFSLYVLQADGSELLAGLEQLENGAAPAHHPGKPPGSPCMHAKLQLLHSHATRAHHDVFGRPLTANHRDCYPRLICT